MKRVLILILVAVFLLQLCSCNTADSGGKYPVVCQSCSAEQTPGASFCQNCGTKLVTANTCDGDGKVKPSDND